MCDLIVFPRKPKTPNCCSEEISQALAIKFPGDFMENGLTGEFYCSVESWTVLSRFFGCLGYDVQNLETVEELYKVWIPAASDAKAVLDYLEHPSRFRAAHQLADKKWLNYIQAVAEGDLQLARHYIQGPARALVDEVIG